MSTRPIADPLVADLLRVLRIVRDAFAESKADTEAEMNAIQNAYKATCWAIEQAEVRAARRPAERCGWSASIGGLCLAERPCPKHDPPSLGEVIREEPRG